MLVTLGIPEHALRFTLQGRCRKSLASDCRLPRGQEGYMARKGTVCSSSLLLSTFLADGVFHVSRHVAQFASQLLFFFVFFFSPQEIIKMNLYVSSQIDRRSRNADFSQLTPQFPAYQTPRSRQYRAVSFTSTPLVPWLTSKCRQWLPTDAHLVDSSGFLSITFSIQDSNGFRCEELSVWTGGRGLLLFVLVLLVVGLPSWLSWYQEL